MKKDISTKQRGFGRRNNANARVNYSTEYPSSFFRYDGPLSREKEREKDGYVQKHGGKFTVRDIYGTSEKDMC